ncbi:hypothetical protein DFH29DRAFT_1008193 [Suillus ampliporus]|nr:hypothetical protein DFH29DRAFT_1008193 [Suillus ampliporus]
MSLPDRPLDVSDNFGVDGNFIVIDVENLLIDWPTYLLEFTPKNPGPVKLILRLKDVSKLTWDQDSDTETPAEKKSGKRSLHSTTTDTSTSISETSYKPKNVSTLIRSIPVHFLGIQKEPALVMKKCKFQDENSIWPPHRSCAFRPVSDLPISAFGKLNILPAGVSAVTEDTV